MLRKLTLLSLGMLFALLLAACNGAEHETDKNANEDTKTVDSEKTVATVNGEKIKGEKYNIVLQKLQGSQQNASHKKLKEIVIDVLVGQKLILQDAEKKGYQASEKKVNQQLDQIKEQVGDEKKFNQFLKQQNLTEEQLKKNLSQQLTYNTYVNEEVEVDKVSEKEINDAYKEYSANTEEAQKLEKVKPQIKRALKKKKEEQGLSEIVNKLKENSEIKVLI